MEYINYLTSYYFLLFILGIIVFGAKEKTLVRIASFTFTVYMLSILIRNW